jgi:DNA-3-methyladenine glycosylase II
MTPAPLRYTADDSVSRALAEADPRLGAIIDRVGGVSFDPIEADDPFTAVIRGIVGQQLSDKAASTIFNRLKDRVGITPRALAEADTVDLRAAGLSGRKSEYVAAAGAAVASGELDLNALESLPDDEVEARLTSIRGVGPWTAHMYLLFALRRPDVIAPGDLGIRQATGRLLGLGRPATPSEVLTASEAWRPYRSAATLYLYREAGMGAEAGPPRTDTP